MSLQTSSVSDVKNYDMSLTVSLTSYSGVASITKNFVVTITCEVQTLIFSTAPPNSTILKVGIDIQPSNIPFEISQTPACGNTATFTMSPTQTFISLSTLTSSTGGNVQINGATLLHVETYQNTLTALVDGI